MDGIDGEIQNGVAVAKEADALAILPSPSDGKATTIEDLTTQALQFLSTASTETIGAIIAALIAFTWLLLGRVGLILIGAVGGIVLHATWETQSSATVQDGKREKGLDIAKRLLDLRDTVTKIEDDNHDSDVSGSNFESFKPETATALGELVEAVIDNYVKWWYDPILPSEQSFPSASRETLSKFILSLSAHLARKRPADTFLDFLTNSSSIVIVFLNELTSAILDTQGSTVPVAEAVHTYLAENPESNLANVLNIKQQSKKFKMIAEDMLQKFLERPAYECDPARAFLREILAGVVFESTLKSCSKPEWINGWIVYLLEEGEPDLSQAIDAGMVSAADQGITKTAKAQEEKGHRKRLSRAEEAMEEALEEAKRISRLIAEEDAKKVQTPEIAGGNVPALPVQAAIQELHSPEAREILSNNETTSGTMFTEPFAQSSTTPQQDVLPPDQQSPASEAKPISPKSPPTTTPFTSFDQIVPPSTPSALQNGSPMSRRKTVSLTLHNANIIIHDDSTPSDRGKIRNKPNGDYLVQIEPSSSDHPGWMIVRRYSDFETLHEVLRRIAQISGVTAFAEQHNALPSWKEHTKASLRGELERYLRDACWYQPLADSEGMKRFLEKEQGQTTNSNQKTGLAGLGWPTPSAFETMGKGMLDVLTSAPKGVAEGGKVIGGGLSGVFNNIGNLGQKKSTPNGSSANVGTSTPGRASTSTLSRMDSATSLSGIRRGRASEDSLRTVAPAIIQTQPSKIPPMERRPSHNSIVEEENERQPRASSARSSMSSRRSATLSRDPSRAPSRKNTPLSSPIQGMIEGMRLPPPPSDVADDYSGDSHLAHSRTESSGYTPTTRTSTSTAPSQPSPGRSSLSIPRSSSVPVAQSPSRKTRKEFTPLTEPETRVAVELIFAVINELYTLSSAWNIRRTLLTAAKTYLLRPGNPSLSSIQTLIQDSVIAANTSDAGISYHLRKLRANTMPTEEELKAWPPEMSAAEKQRLRLKAKKLLVERGMPAALTGVMGQAASSEAMGRVFEVLQEEEVARGLIFALLLQSVRAVTH